MIALVEKLYRILIVVAQSLRSPVLLLIRLFWGWQFFIAGKGKLMDLDKTSAYFETLGIPLPHAQAILAASTECFGGLLLLIGLASRLISIPLMGVMIVAYLTADFEAARALFSEPDKFVASDEFLFLFAALLIFVFGPGLFSVDGLIAKYFRRNTGKPV
ncbi:MAG: DoxX family protein [Chthoniobacterales bacterium]